MSFSTSKTQDFQQNFSFFKTVRIIINKIITNIKKKTTQKRLLNDSIVTYFYRLKLQTISLLVAYFICKRGPRDRLLSAISMMVFEEKEKRLRSASVWVIDALKSAATGPLSPRTRRRALKKQRNTVS